MLFAEAENCKVVKYLFYQMIHAHELWLAKVQQEACCVLTTKYCSWIQ